MISPPAPTRRPPHRARHEEPRPEIQVEHLLHRRVVRVRHALSAGEAAHHVDQGIDTAQLRDYLGDHMARRFTAGQIGGHGGEVRVLELAGLDVPGDAGDFRAGFEECVGDGGAQAAGRAGDQRDLAFE